MKQRGFRFGVVAATARSGAEWAATARRVEELGYDTLLVPDTRQTLEPFAAVAAAAAVTRTLRVGTYVLSAPNRPPGLVAWQSGTLRSLSDGRFDLGIGAGRPGAEGDAAAVGRDYGTPAERLAQVAATIAAVREIDDGPPVMVAASRPRMLRLAAERADMVALGLPPQAGEDALGRTVETLRAAAGDRLDELELHLNYAAVAATPAEVPAWLSRMVGGDPREMAAAGAIGFLIGTPERIAEVLLGRRERFGITYVAVGGPFMDQFAPVMSRLRAA